jgi:hypothetical protein
MRHALRLALVVALALGGASLVLAQGIQTEVATLSVGHEAVDCMVAGQHPMIEARLAPSPYVQSGRVYFHSGLGDTFYYVEMVDMGGLFVGTLPRPSSGAGPVTYYVEGVATNYSQTQTTETMALVVDDESECEGRLAAVAPPGTPVQVFSTTGTTTLPPGFSGVSSVMSATGGGAAATGATASTASTGSFIDSTGGRIVVGAAAIGVATAVVVTRGPEEPPPVSESR